MTFIIIFITLSLASPLLFEIKKKGKDNTLFRAGTQLVDFTVDSFKSATKNSKTNNYRAEKYKSHRSTEAIFMGNKSTKTGDFSNKLKEKFNKLLEIVYLVIFIYVIYIIISFIFNFISFLLGLIF